MLVIILNFLNQSLIKKENSRLFQNLGVMFQLQNLKFKFVCIRSLCRNTKPSK